MKRPNEFRPSFAQNEFFLLSAWASVIKVNGCTCTYIVCFVRQKFCQTGLYSLTRLFYLTFKHSLLWYCGNLCNRLTFGLLLRALNNVNVPPCRIEISRSNVPFTIMSCRLAQMSVICDVYLSFKTEFFYSVWHFAHEHVSHCNMYFIILHILYTSSIFRGPYKWWRLKKHKTFRPFILL